MIQNREEWLRERKTYIGGSDIGAILGLSSFNSALDIYLAKVSDDIHEKQKNDDMAEAAYFGNLLEDLIAKEYARREKVSISEQTGLVRHPKYHFIAANVDRWADDGKYILECKTAHFMKNRQWGETETDDIPDTYLCQAAYYSAICNVPKVDIAVLIGGQDFRVYTYKKNEDFENKLIKQACKFWNEHIVPRIPPEPSDLKDVATLYPVSNGKSILADMDIIDKVHYLKQLKAQENVLAEEIKKVQLGIKNYMKDNEVLVDDEKALVTWKNTNPRNSFDVEKLKKEHEDIFIQYSKAGNVSRPFIIKI
jgi:putative phage-type endonuclease